VSHTCGQTAIDMLTSFTNCNANYLPVPEYVSFLFDLSGLALNIQAILDWSLQVTFTCISILEDKFYLPIADKILRL
jgi:hypothetical protein